MIRLLVVTPTFPHPNSPAEGLFNEQQARALASAGLDVTVVVAKPWLPAALARRTRRWADLANLPRSERRNGMPVHWARHQQVPGYRLPRLTLASCARAVGAVLDDARTGQRFDLLQVHGVWPAGLAAPRIAARLGVPYAITLHIQDGEDLHRRAATAYHRALADAAALVAVGHPLERWLRERYPERVEGKLHTVANGVDLTAVDRAVADRRPQLRPWGRVVSVGNLWPVKGIDLNLRALARLAVDGVPWESYTVVGDGPERPRLESLARELGIAERVRFTGRLPHQEALAAVAAADVFSLPCWQEAFGIATLEAMACAKPAVGCRTQGAEDLIRHGSDGFLVEPRSVGDLADALGRLLQAPDFARRCGQAAGERAREFTWDRNAARYRALYTEILAGVARPPGTVAVAT